MPRRGVRNWVGAVRAARGASNRPDLSAHLDAPDLPGLPPPVRQDVRQDWRVIPSRHPWWWQVHRVVHRDAGLDYELIAECRTEAEAFRVETFQESQVRITKWGSKTLPYFSPRSPARGA
jgi:hypothetical protein